MPQLGRLPEWSKRYSHGWNRDTGTQYQRVQRNSKGIRAEPVRYLSEVEGVLFVVWRGVGQRIATKNTLKRILWYTAESWSRPPIAILYSYDGSPEGIDMNPLNQEVMSMITCTEPYKPNPCLRSSRLSTSSDSCLRVASSGVCG